MLAGLSRDRQGAELFLRVMQSSGLVPSARPVRHRLEDAWWQRLQTSCKKYNAATGEYRGLLRQNPARWADSDSSLDRARRAEAAALAEYARVLKIFADLAVYGKVPADLALEDSKS